MCRWIRREARDQVWPGILPVAAYLANFPADHLASFLVNYLANSLADPLASFLASYLVGQLVLIKKALMKIKEGSSL
jgi:hypothetical protein